MNGFTLLAPWGLVLGLAVAGALGVLHAITVGRPRPAWLPTARFAPDRAPRAERRLARPVDRWLLALRVAAALCAAAALARSVREPVRRHVAHLVLADVSDAGARAAVRDSVRALVGRGDALVTFAATPRSALVAPPHPPSTAADSAALRASIDSALAAAPTGNADSRPSLSAALIAARRAAPALAATADSIELVVVSRFPRDAVDAATLAVRGTWAGRARMVVTRATGDATPKTTARAPADRPSVALRGAPGDDALAAALALAGVVQADAAPVRVLRAAPTPADRAWAADRGHVLVLWPAFGGSEHAAPTPAIPQAVVVGARAAVGAFGRVAVDTDRQQGDSTGQPPTRVIARWADGAPAAVEEQGAPGGCVRTIGVRIPQSGDAALRPDFVALLPALLGPCGAPRDSAPLAPADLARLAGAGSLLAAAPLRAPSSTSLPDVLGAALLALSALLLLAELPLRRFTARSVQGSEPVGDGEEIAPGRTDTGESTPRVVGRARRAAA